MSLIRDVGADGLIIQSDAQRDPNPNVHKPESTGISREEIGFNAIADAMGLDFKERGQFKDKIATILTWAKSKTEDHNPMSLKWVVRDLESRIGSPPFSEKRINYVARYAYLDMEGRRIQAEKSSFLE